MKIFLNEVKQLVESFKTKIFWIILKRIISTQFSVDLGILFKTDLYPGQFPMQTPFFSPWWIKRGSKERGAGRSKFVISSKMISRSWKFA